MEKQTATSPSSTPIKPRIIIHGGAGNITRTNLPPAAYAAYRAVLLSTLQEAFSLLAQPGATALDVATHAVHRLEDNALFNAGHGAVFTTAGTHELEASVMVSSGLRKRGVGLMKLRRVRNPILLAREMLLRGEEVGGGGAGGHCQLEGGTAEGLAGRWGLRMCRPRYLWTKKRWDEHRRGMGLGTDWETYERDRARADGEDDDGCDGGAADGGQVRSVVGRDDPSWDGEAYLPQGTVGCVVLDSTGTLCVATSTGGLTNKLPGRIGDTPTLGAGFWAEQWLVDNPFDRPDEGLVQRSRPSPMVRLLNGDFMSVVSECLPDLPHFRPIVQADENYSSKSQHHGVAMSGTGNGDSFLRLSAARTTASMTRFSTPTLPLQWSVSRMAGPKGMLQQSAEDRWRKTGEGEGGIIGIECKLGQGSIVADFNCGGMFRAWIDDNGQERMMVFRENY